MQQEQFEREVIDACVKTYIQGVPSVDSEGNCRYLSRNGNKCAIGHMMTEEELEKYGGVQAGVFQLTKEYRDGWRVGVYSYEQLVTLGYLQKSHDRNRYSEDFRHDFVRALENIKIPPVFTKAAEACEQWHKENTE